MGPFQNPLKFVQQTSISESSREKRPLSGTQSYLHFKIKTKRRSNRKKSTLDGVTVKIIMQYGPTSMIN